MLASKHRACAYIEAPRLCWHRKTAPVLRSKDRACADIDGARLCASDLSWHLAICTRGLVVALRCIGAELEVARCGAEPAPPVHRRSTHRPYTDTNQTPDTDKTHKPRIHRQTQKDRQTQTPTQDKLDRGMDTQNNKRDRRGDKVLV